MALCLFLGRNRAGMILQENLAVGADAEAGDMMRTRQMKLITSEQRVHVLLTLSL